MQLLPLCTLTALMLASGPSAGLADLRALDLWQSWQMSAARNGLKLQAAKPEAQPQGMVLRDLQLTLPGRSLLRLDQLTLQENAAGQVELRPGTARLQLSSAPLGATLQVTHQDLMITASDTGPDGLRYSFAAPVLETTLRLPTAGDSPQEQTVTRLTDLRGSYSDESGTLRQLKLELAADRLQSQTLDSTDPGAEPLATSDTEGLVLRGDFAWPVSLPLGQISSPADLRQALSAGLSVSFDMAQGLTRGDSRAPQPLPYRMQLRSEPAKGKFAMDAQGLTLSAESGRLGVHVTSPLLQGPVDVDLSALALSVAAPMVAQQVPAPYAVRLAIRDMTVSEAAWAMFDSGRLLPRDPLQLELDLSGTTRQDLTTLATGPVPGLPASPETLSIHKLLLTLAGAEARLAGDFSFDTGAPAPRPLGTATLRLSGAGQLITSLTTLGLLSQANAGIAEGMLSQLTTPEAGVDLRSTQIEARPDGGLYVNGTRMD